MYVPLLIKVCDLKIVLREVILHCVQVSLNRLAQCGVWKLLQDCFQSLLCFERVRYLAVRQAHLSNLRFRNLQHSAVRKRVSREEGYPVLISLSGLYERTGSPFQKERIGYSKLRQRKERRIGVGRDDCVEEKPSRVVITFANFVSGHLEKLPVASRRNRVGQLCVLVVAASAAEDAKEFSFLLLVSLLC